MNKSFCFTVDDNIRFLKEITEGNYPSVFDHPYLAMYRRLHEVYGVCVQLNLFYECEGFTLASMTDAYREEFSENAHWLKMSFHSKLENVRPYITAEYDEVFSDAMSVQREIVRFAGESVLAKTTTLHYCLATLAGINAMKDVGMQGLLGLYGTKEAPRLSYQTSEEDARRIRGGEIIYADEVAYSGIDIVLNCYTTEEDLALLGGYFTRPHINVMIHEQYFYPDYPFYQKDFENKLSSVFSALAKENYVSTFFENVISRKERI